MRVFARVFAENCVGEGSGRDISVKCTLFIRVAGFSTVRTTMVSDAVDMGMAPQADPGMTVYFANGNETLWDVAKKFNTPVDNVKKYNLDLTDENLSAGQRVLVFNKRS
jgi:hypothetical protein